MSVQRSRDTLYILLCMLGAMPGRESLPRSFHMRVTVWRRIRSCSKTVHIFMDARHASPICSSRRSPSADSFCVQLNEPRLRYGVIILRYHKKKKKKKRERERERERGSMSKRRRASRSSRGFVASDRDAIYTALLQTRFAWYFFKRVSYVLLSAIFRGCSSTAECRRRQVNKWKMRVAFSNELPRSNTNHLPYIVSLVDKPEVIAARFNDTITKPDHHIA